jgi:hypothetical protein
MDTNHYFRGTLDRFCAPVRHCDRLTGWEGVVVVLGDGTLSTVYFIDVGAVQRVRSSTLSRNCDTHRCS